MVRVNGIKHIASIISPYNRGEKILLEVLSNLKQQKKASPIPVLFNALKQLAPGLKVLPQIRAGRTIFLSASLTEKSSRYYAMRWCLNTDNVNLKTPLHQRLTSDLLDAFQKTGHAYSFKKDLNQSVINSRVNAKPIYRGKPKRVLKKLFKRKRKTVYKFRRLIIVRTRFKIKRKAKFNPRVKTKRYFRFRLKFKLKPKKKKIKSRPLYLSDHIPPSIKSRVRDKKEVFKQKLQFRTKLSKKTYKKRSYKALRKPYKKTYKKRYNKPYKKLFKNNKKNKKKTKKVVYNNLLKKNNSPYKNFFLRLKLKKKKKIKLSGKLFKERISYIISILSIIKTTSNFGNNTKNNLGKTVKKKVLKKTKNLTNKNKNVANSKKKVRKTKKKVNPDNHSVIRKKKKLLKKGHASKSNTNQ